MGLGESGGKGVIAGKTLKSDFTAPMNQESEGDLAPSSWVKFGCHRGR